MNADDFKPVTIDITPREKVFCTCAAHKEENILLITLSGVCEYGSRGENYGRFFYEKIGLAILKHQPNAILVDMRNLSYEYGDRIVGVFQIFNEVRIFGDDTVLAAFVLSDKNIKGIASLLGFHLNHPEPPIFLDIHEAYTYLYEYDKI
ncbi:hypothetical protein NBRC110019_16350 [Neptunitalea chrysea]|uniref:STAS domain-containing protein n=1 Tax=Neptunitalea chrysea TaxID=1647581 RepID=A0A9W6ETU8_9FLAO|nr:hypothetical protein [Neptunitalea chrysea]GLB52595.1 hypothetical protein NBRC110019_16350 [Neptunitalea chrysea]